MKRIPNIIKLFILGLFLLVFAFPRHGLAQKKINPEHYGGRDTDSVPVYHYEIVRNRPDSVARLTFGFYPLGFTENTFGNNLLEGYLSYDLQKKFALYGILSIAYYDGYFSSYPSPVTFIPDINLEIGGNYYLYLKTLRTNAITYLSTNPGTSIAARFERNHLFKAGFKASLGYINSIVPTDNEYFIGYNIRDPQMKKISFVNYLSPTLDPYTNAAIPYLSVGMVMERVKDIAAKIEKFRKTEVMHKTVYYLDLLAAPYVHYDDIVITQGATIPPGEYNVDKYSPRQYFGFRTGCDFYSLQEFGITMGAETGYMPNSGGFVTVRAGLAFSPKKVVDIK